MKKFLKFLMVAALPALFVQQCDVSTTTYSCAEETTTTIAFVSVTQLKCTESVDLTEADCPASSGSTVTTFSASSCDATLYTHRCDALTALGLTINGSIMSDALVYYGGTDSTYATLTGNTECLAAGGTLTTL